MTTRATLSFLCLLIALPVAAEDRFCTNDLFTIDARHDGGDLDKCRFRSDDSVELTFRQEDKKVDDAYSWFSFRVSARDEGVLRIRLKFPRAYARYWPKVSSNGQDWRRLNEEAVQVSTNGRNMTLTLAVGSAGLWVSAQELLTQAFYDDWLRELDARTELQTAVIGRSVEGRPVHLARTADRPEVVLLFGRQHPAEVPGALAMREFVDVLLADTELARRFRGRFALLIVPLINPDGVANGHSRHNSGGVDLNRDWGPFTQPETQSVARLLEGLDDLGMRPRLMLDFHATKMTPTMVFYTQVPEDNTSPALFATTWMTRVGERLDGYAFKHDPRTPSGLDNTKNYFFSRYGIPAITYEIGDEADRKAIIEHTPAFAEEMMRTLLEAD